MSRRRAESPDDDGSDTWSYSSGDSKYSDSDSSVPEWDPDVAEDGELVYIKYKDTDQTTVSHSKTSLLDNADTFKNRNNFKRTSTRRASKGKMFKVLRYRQTKKADSNKDKHKQDECVSSSNDAAQTNKQSNCDVTVEIERNKHFHSERRCQIEEMFGVSVTKSEDGKDLVVSSIITGAHYLFEGKVKKGYRLHSINDHEVNAMNINIVLDKLRYNRNKCVLTFIKPQETLNIEFKNLLTSKTEHEYVLSQALRDSMVCSIYIRCDALTENDTDHGVMYCYPRPYAQNFLYNTRGAFVTLNHLSSKGLFESPPISSTIRVNNVLINVLYVQRNEDLMLVAIPNRRLNMFGAKMAVDGLVRLLDFIFGSLRGAFSERSNLYKVDRLMSRFFTMLLCGFDDDTKTMVEMEVMTRGDVNRSSLFEDVLPVAHLVTLPMEARLQIDDALTELEAADYREWTDDLLNSQRLFVVIGCCLYYSGHLLSSHLQDDDLMDIQSFLRVHGLLKLSRMGNLDKMVIWKEVYVSAHRKQAAEGITGDEYRVPDGRWFLLIIGKGNFILASIMEAGGCTENCEENPPPSPFYVEECESCLELLIDVGLGRFLASWFSCNSRPQLQLSPEYLSKQGRKMRDMAGSPKADAKTPKQNTIDPSVMKRRHHSSDQINLPSTSDQSNYTGSHHNLYSQWYQGGSQKLYGVSSNLDAGYSEDSNSQIGNSEINEERVLGRRADREKSRRDSSGSDSEWEGQGDSRTSGSLDMSDIRKSLFDDIDCDSTHRVTAGEENVLFHYVQLEGSRGLLLAPVKDLEMSTSSSLYGHILKMFRVASQKIQAILQNTLSFKKTQLPSPCVNKSLVSVKEHGILFQAPPHLFPQGAGRKTTEVYQFWVVGRLFDGPDAKELYVCYHDSVPQDMLEVAFKLSFLE